MAKEFYTEKDVEDLFKRGVTSLNVTEDVVLTELAYEKANRLGMKLVHGGHDNPPSAPVRPYVSQQAKAQARPSYASAPAAPAASPVRSTPGGSGSYAGTHVGGASEGGDLRSRIRSAVVARLGTQVDSQLLDAIITRVLNATGTK